MTACPVLATVEDRVGHAGDILSDIRKNTDAHPDVLKEASDRTLLVRTTAERLTTGSLRSYRRGSIEQHTQNDPVNDGDAGLVQPGELPEARPRRGRRSAWRRRSRDLHQPGTAIREICSGAVCRKSKRGPKMFVN